MVLSSIIWNVNPVIFSIGSLSVRWYGLLWAVGILLCLVVVQKIFKHEGAPDDWTDKLFIYTVIGTIIGARLGHVFFYDWGYYSQHPGEILKIWHGGLASHGGAIGILVALYFFNKKVTKLGFLWGFDRLVIGATLTGVFIRLGNLMNSEIYGHPTTLPWGFVFVRGDFYPNQPCHPTQIYEALAYLLIFGILMWLYWKKNAGKYSGLLAGIGIFGIFVARQLIEFLKNPQEAFEESMKFNMGQLLSIPFIIAGIILVVYALKKGPVEYKMPKVEPSKTSAKKKK